jgi:cell division protein FtsW
MGVAGGALIFLVPLRRWERSGFFLLAFALFLLILVLLPGVGQQVNGSQRWLNLGPISVEASEPARLCLLIYVAGYAVRRHDNLHTLGGLLKPLIPLGAAAMLMLLEPDFGGAVVLLAVSMVMLFVAGTRLRNFALFAALGVAGLSVIAVASPYRVERLVSFTDPWADPFDSGFQLVQSLIAIGRGKLFGVGLGNSVQKLLYLPETQTDFLFAIIGEELGLLGCTVVITLFTLVVWRGFVIGRRALMAGHRFGSYLSYGLATWFGLQAFINMGVTMGLLPTKGTTLPLMSYGGSSLLVTCVLIALLLRVDYETRMTQAEESERRHARLSTGRARP